MAIDAGTVRRFVRLAGERLRGEWVILGGAVLPLLGAGVRVTVDIDVAGPDGGGNDQTLALLDLAESVGLAPEAVNQAAAHFLRKVRGWRSDLVEVHRGPRATIFRPGATLFVLLKIPRLSDADLEDCRAMLGYAARTGEKVDGARLRRAIRNALRSAIPDGRRQRLTVLLHSL